MSNERVMEEGFATTGYHQRSVFLTSLQFAIAATLYNYELGKPEYKNSDQTARQCAIDPDELKVPADIEFQLVHQLLIIPGPDLTGNKACHLLPVFFDEWLG